MMFFRPPHQLSRWIMLGLASIALLHPARASSEEIKKLVVPGETFRIDGRPAYVLMPAEGLRSDPQPWAMQTPTLSKYPSKHDKWWMEQLLAAGVAVAGVDAGEAYGSPYGTKMLSLLYDQVTEERGFARKPCLLARSRGGLWASNWAIENPEKVAGIGGIYPVFDLRSYPGLAKAAPAYKLTEAELESQLERWNPIARASKLAKAQIPIHFVHGDSDKVVPLEKNSKAVAAIYQAAGVGELIELKVLEGQGHNYYEGFFKNQPLVDFVVERAKAGAKQ